MKNKELSCMIQVRIRWELRKGTGWSLQGWVENDYTGVCVSTLQGSVPAKALCVKSWNQNGWNCCLPLSRSQYQKHLLWEESNLVAFTWAPELSKCLLSVALACNLQLLVLNSSGLYLIRHSRVWWEVYFKYLKCEIMWKSCQSYFTGEDYVF